MSDLPDNTDLATPRELLPAFYKKYNLDADGGQSLPYVKVEFFKKFALYIPNSDVRRRAVFKHDVHHLVTGYPSLFKGETEISAWEVGSGVKKYWIAWVLDMQALMIGILFNPLNVFRAYARGRRTKNLYDDKLDEKVVLDMSIRSIRKKLKLDVFPEKTNGNFPDLILFLGLLLIGLVYSVLSILLIPFVLLYTFWIMIIKKTRHDTNITTGS